MVRTRLAAAGWMAVALLCPAGSRAATQVSNLAQTASLSFTANGSFAHACSFTTDATSVYELNGISAEVSSSSSGSSALHLRRDAQSAPSIALESLGTSSIGAGTSVVTYGSAGTVIGAGSTYWITLGESGSGSFAWSATTSTAESSPSAWTIGDQAMFSGDGGASWAAVNAGPPNESCKLSVDATAITPAVSSLLETRDSSYAYGQGVWASVSFTTGSTQNELDRVMILASTPNGGSLTAALYSNSSVHKPDTLIEEAPPVQAASSTSNSLFSFDFTSRKLTPDTTYWIVLYATNGAVVVATTSNEHPSSGTWSLGTRTWSGVFPNPNWVSTNVTPIVAIEATQIPFDCSDGIDNDGDGLTDYPNDPGCQTPSSVREDPACNNGLDDDHDSFVDYPADPQCVAAWSMSENPPAPPGACGLGAELALLLPPLAWLRRRRAGARHAATQAR